MEISSQYKLRKAMEQESTNNKALFSCAMKGKWDEVIDMYRQDERLHEARITRSGHTALHIAVADGKEDVVKRMTRAIMSLTNKEKLVKALRTPNHRNNTALHLAASMGNARMCRIIASMDATLADDRNLDGETPLFLAALHGRKQAFLCLHFIRNPDTTAPPFCGNCRRNNGDTILHAAIHGNYFDIAFPIIHLYKELANSVNEEGCSPLHLLASKPSAFKSGSRLGWIETIIYHCIYVGEFKLENQEHQECPSAAEDSDGHDFPDNYNTLWEAYRLIKKAVKVVFSKPTIEADAENPGAGESRDDRRQAKPLFPDNYKTCYDLIKFFYLVIVTIFGKGSEEWRRIYQKKQTHTWSVHMVKKILDSTSSHEYEDDGREPQDKTSSLDATLDASSIKPSSIEDKEDEQSPKKKTTETPILVAAKNGVVEIIGKIDIHLNCAEDKQSPKKRTIETPILVAAKNGVVEIIKNIVEFFPVAIYDLNEDKKNIVLLAVEHNQPQVYEFLQKKNIYKESLFHQVDKDGNTALHLAATLRDDEPWVIPGEALQMQWEIKWYKFVNKTMPPEFLGRYNNKKETPDCVFTRTHKDLQKRAAEWLRKTSESCSVVAALIATVAFATAATVPGGVIEKTGHPRLEYESEFQLFAISSLIALGFSITALVMFLSILTSRFQERDFHKDLPGKLLIGLTSLFMSIAFMLMSFCAGHFFVLNDTLHYLALPIYVVTCLPATLFVLAQFGLYADLLWAHITRVPQSSCRPTT